MGIKNIHPGALAVTRIAQGQTFERKVLEIGKGMTSIKTDHLPFREVDGGRVYHVSLRQLGLTVPEFDSRKLHKWGEFYHPYLMIGMPDLGGQNKVYIDTRIEGMYLLWVSTKLDEWLVGPSSWQPDQFLWTPKMKNDSVVRAGYRLFRTFILNMEDVADGQFYCPEFDENWPQEWPCSERCFQVLASIRPTRFSSEQEKQAVINAAPAGLRPFIEADKKTE